jgi:hypothetical protein
VQHHPGQHGGVCGDTRWTGSCTVAARGCGYGEHTSRRVRPFPRPDPSPPSHAQGEPVEGRARLSLWPHSPRTCAPRLGSSRQTTNPTPNKLPTSTAPAAPSPAPRPHSTPRHARNLRYERDCPQGGSLRRRKRLRRPGLPTREVREQGCGVVAERLVRLVGMVAAAIMTPTARLMVDRSARPDRPDTRVVGGRSPSSCGSGSAGSTWIPAS